MEEMTLSDVLASRTATYGLLARLFRVEVDREFYDELLALRFPAHTGDADVDEGYKKICSYLSAPHPDAVTELAVDYVRTFIGGGNNGYSAAYPFESVYTSPKRLLMQGARDEVLIIYRAAGIDKKPSWTDGEDHIALELEFMHIIGDRAKRALDQGDEDGAAGFLEQQKNFLESHLASWFPMMAADMRKFSKTDFYQGLAQLTMGFLRTDREFLEDVLEVDDETCSAKGDDGDAA